MTFKLEKNTFCKPEVQWFGRIFSQTGMSCDKKKVEIIAAGRPGNTEDVRSFLQVVVFNAKFAFDHEEATMPLRELLVKDTPFQWNQEREESYKMLKCY